MLVDLAVYAKAHARTVCSEIANGRIVALCGLKSKQGSACIVKHIYDQWYTVKLNVFGTTRKHLLPSDHV